MAPTASSKARHAQVRIFWLSWKVINRSRWSRRLPAVGVTRRDGSWSLVFGAIVPCTFDAAQVRRRFDSSAPSQAGRRGAEGERDRADAEQAELSVRCQRLVADRYTWPVLETKLFAFYQATRSRK